MSSIEDSRVKGKRHLDTRTRQTRQISHVVENYRMTFLRNLKPEHPLYCSAEARVARGSSNGVKLELVG
jgi:hypothetical protein